MTLDDRIVLGGMVLAALVFLLGNIVRTFRRLARTRPALFPPSAQTRRYVMARPPVRRPEPPARPPPPPRRSAPPKRRPPPPTLESRVFRNRRLSSGARLIVASEILSSPKALRPRRPL